MLALSRHQKKPSALPLSSSCSSHRSARLKTSNPCNHRNQQYSIIGLTNAAGTLVERYSYTAYGTLGIYDPSGTVRTTSTYANRYTYTGREYDADLNLYHFRARWYDLATGGFISRDPLWYVHGMSLYRGYFGVKRLDPNRSFSVVQDQMNGSGGIVSVTVPDEDIRPPVSRTGGTVLVEVPVDWDKEGTVWGSKETRRFKKPWSWLWKHGYYCGYGNNNSGMEPVDALDEACKIHDTCLGTSSQCFTPFRRAYWRYNQKLGSVN